MGARPPGENLKPRRTAKSKRQGYSAMVVSTKPLQIKKLNDLIRTYKEPLKGGPGPPGKKVPSPNPRMKSHAERPRPSQPQNGERSHRSLPVKRPRRPSLSNENRPRKQSKSSRDSKVSRPPVTSSQTSRPRSDKLKRGVSTHGKKRDRPDSSRSR